MNNANLYAHFLRHFPADLETPLLDTEDGRCVSYGEADAASAQIANILLDMGAVPGDRVTVQVEKSPENLFLYLGCLRAGLVYHPLNTAYTESELRYFLGDAEPAIIVCKREAKQLIENLISGGDVRGVLTLDADGGGTLMARARSASNHADIAPCKGTDMAALLYSSGTTGRPKGIMLSHDNLRSNAQTLVEIWGFDASDRLLHALPIYHVHGLFVAISCVLMSGASMVWHGGFNAAKAAAVLPQCTVMMGVPTFYTRLLAEPAFDAGLCANMRLFISGSAPLLADTFAEFKRRTGHDILERYGMSETGMNTSNPLHGERRAGTVGPPLPDVALRIVDDDGNAVGIGETGNLQVKGPNVFSGYWHLPGKTAEDFTDDGFFNTGDKAMMDADGYVAIVGRAKDLVITGGLNVYPKEVELVVDELPGVLESAIIGVPDADFGEAVLAVIIPDESPDAPPDSAAVIAHCREHLANFKVPKRVETMAALPRNAMGKVQKNLLREQYGA